MAIRRRSWLVPALGVALCMASPAAAQETYDVLIRGGRVLDGSGTPWFRADVALRGDRVAAVGDLSAARAATVIDASGLYVAPGFMDVHSHSGDGLANPALKDAKPLIAQGVTTVFVNPDGGGPVDLAAQRRRLEQGGVGGNCSPAPIKFNETVRGTLSAADCASGRPSSGGPSAADRYRFTATAGHQSPPER